jgi:hypothetical protein
VREAGSAACTCISFISRRKHFSVADLRKMLQPGCGTDKLKILRCGFAQQVLSKRIDRGEQ